MTKVVVMQPGRQHTHLLLQGLQNKGMLRKFYTVFAANKLGLLIHVLPNKLKSQLKKRSFPNIPAHNIAHYPQLFFLEQLGSIGSEAEMIKKIYQPFDLWVAKKLRQSSPEVLIGYENANLEAFKKAKTLGITTVLDLAQIHHQTILDIHSNYGFLNESYTPKVLDFINTRKALALEYTNYILTLSTFARDSLMANGIDARKIITVNLGVNLQTFYPKINYTQQSKFQFLFVGTITKRKGLALLLEAFKILDLPNTELVLIGPMADGAALLEHYKGLYRYHPFMHHESLANAYRNADVFVFPSYLDSWAQTVVEAMACGTPAIVSEHTGSKDAVKQGGGFVVPVGDLEALMEKMSYFYQNQNRIEELGRKAAIIARQYTTDNYHDQIIQALNQIADEQNKG